MRRGLGFLGLVLTLIVIAVVGVIAYNVGVSDGVAQHLPAGTSTAPAVYPYPYYGYYGFGPHFFGFGWIFGLLFFLFFLFVIFRVARFAMFGGRGWGHYGPGGWHQYREERMREWHDRAHGGQSPSSSPPPPPPPTTA